MKNNLAIVSGLCLLASIGCGSASSTTATTTTTGGGGTTSGTKITLTGQAAVASTDLNLATAPTKALAKKKRIAPVFKTLADSALPSADVTLYKMNADGTETKIDIGTVTTDSSGSYTITDVPASTSGTGATTDFYYEVRAASGDLTVVAPTAPTADTTVNVSPETHLAAKMLTDVQGVSDKVLPDAKTVENLRTLTADEITNDLSGSVTLPSLGNSNGVLITATAIGSDNGNAEKALRAFEAEKEAVALTAAGTGADAGAVGAYLERVTKQGCDFNAQFNLPELARDALATAFASGTTFTPTDIATAYNANNGNNPDSTAASAVTKFDNVLTNLDTSIAGGTEIASADQIGMYVKGNLTAATFDAETPLKTDQALAVAQELFPTPCQASAFDVVGFVSDLTGITTITDTPSIVDTQIFNDSTGACQNGKGHLRADIQVYAAGGATVNGVTLTHNGVSQALTQNGNNGPFSRWQLPNSDQDAQGNQNFYCVTLPSTVDYTINVDLNGADDLTDSVSKKHVTVPEAKIQMVDITDGSASDVSGQMGSPTVTTDKRPVFKWSPAPGTPDSSVIPDAPTGSKIKFTFELSYIDITAQQVAPLNQCGLGGSGAKLMDRNYFVADVDCDIAACATASHISASNIVCRTNIQTFLVDENDRLLGQAGGNFRFYK